MITLKVALDDRTEILITGRESAEFVTLYGELGGNADALVAQLGSKLADIETGRAVAAVERAGMAQHGASESPPKRDPWQSPPEGASGPQRGSDSPTGTITVDTPNGPQHWQVSPPNAPLCMCGEPSALVTGSKRNGGTYRAYRCAKGAGGDWRSKCDFNRWA